MNDGVLAVNFGQMATAGGDIANALSKLKADLDELKSIGGALADTWEGEARQAYYDKQKRWSDAAEALAENLRTIQRALDDSTSDYMSTEKKATSLFQ
jgi:early secretory antigenic target protein ESAT-6